MVATDCPSTCRKRLLSGVGSVMWYKWSDCDVAGPSASCGEEQSSDIQTAEVTPECYKESSVYLSRLCSYCWMFCDVFVCHTFHTSSLSLPAVCQLISIQLTHSIIHSKHHAVGILEGAYLWWLETPLQSEYLFKQTQSRRCKLSNSCY